MPIRNLIVTGTGPAFATTARTSRASSRGRAGSAEPPPDAVTLRTGQPKFMSMWSAPHSSARIRAALPRLVGCVP